MDGWILRQAQDDGEVAQDDGEPPFFDRVIRQKVVK